MVRILLPHHERISNQLHKKALLTQVKATIDKAFSLILIYEKATVIKIQSKSKNC